MRLSDKQAIILDAAQLDFRQSILQIARTTRLRHHTVRHALKTLKEAKIIKPFMLFNPHALGLTDYCMFFSHQGEEKQARKKIIDLCVKSPQLAFVEEVAGNYQYSVSLFARSIFEVEQFFALLGKHFPNSSFPMSFAVRSEWTIFSRRHLAANNKQAKLLIRSEVESESKIDKLDHDILCQVGSIPDQPLSEIAKNLKVPESTIRHRLSLLEKNGIILGFPYLVDASRFGRCCFRVLISSKGQDLAFSKNLRQFAISHPAASAFVRCVGAWDFEINFETESPEQVGSIVEAITDRFGANIRQLQTLMDLAIHKSHHYPPALAAVVVN